MKEHNYLQKSLLIVTAIAFILCILVTYFSWKSSQNRQAYENAQNELNMTQETLQIKENELNITQENLQIEIEKSIGLNQALEQSAKELTMANTTISDLKNDEYELVYMGEFKYTYYCNEPYEHICGYGLGITASGKPTEVGWTVAADTSVLPMGSIIYVEGIGFREVEDVGGAVKGNHIDILLDTHSECFEQTLVDGGVWILVKKS